MRIEVLVLCSLLFVSPISAVFGQGLSFDGLLGVPVEDNGTNIEKREITFDTSEIDAELRNAKVTVEELLDIYRDVLLLVDSDDGEYLKTGDSSRFEQLKTKSRHYNQKLEEARIALFKVDLRLDGMGLNKMSRDEWMALGPQLRAQTRYLTIYNTILDFGLCRKICYDTIMPLDKQTIEFAFLNSNCRQSFPNIFGSKAYIREARAIDKMALYEVIPLEELDKAPRANFAAEQVQSLLEEGKDLAARAHVIKERLLRQGDEKEKNGKLEIEFDCSKELFASDHKSSVLDYSEAVIRLKAVRNEFVVSFIITKNDFADYSLITKWYELEANLSRLVKWGLKTRLRCSGQSVTFFLDEQYENHYLVPKPASLQGPYIERRNEQYLILDEMRSKGMITTAEALEILRNTDPEQLYEKAVEVSAKVFDLTAKNKKAIKELVDTKMQEYWEDNTDEVPDHSDSEE